MYAIVIVIPVLAGTLNKHMPHVFCIVCKFWESFLLGHWAKPSCLNCKICNVFCFSYQKQNCLEPGRTQGLRVFPYFSLICPHTHISHCRTSRLWEHRLAKHTAKVLSSCIWSKLRVKMYITRVHFKFSISVCHLFAVIYLYYIYFLYLKTHIVLPLVLIGASAKKVYGVLCLCAHTR